MCKAYHSRTIKFVYDIRDSVMEGFIQEENKDILIKKEPFFIIVGTKVWQPFLMYLWNFVDHLWHDRQATHKGAGGHESSR